GQYDEDELIERGAGTVSGLVDRDDGGDDAAIGNADDPAASTWGRRCGSDTVWAANRKPCRRLSPGLGNRRRRRLARGSDHRCVSLGGRPSIGSSRRTASGRRLPVHAPQDDLLADLPQPDGLPLDPLVSRPGGRTSPGPGARPRLLGLLLGADGGVRGRGRDGSVMGRDHRGGYIRGVSLAAGVRVRPRDGGRTYRRRSVGGGAT